MGYLPVGNYRLLVLFNNNDYLLKDTIRIKKDGINYYAMDGMMLHKKDSMSIQVNNILNVLIQQIM